MKNKLVLIAAVVMAIVFIYLKISASWPTYREVIINDTTIRAEIADTIGKQQKGLSGRDSLGENQGILFIFGLPSQRSFWMKEMKFPIDIIWLRDGKVVEITENLPPPRGFETPASVTSKELVDTVLEVNVGFARKYNIKVDDLVAGY